MRAPARERGAHGRGGDDGVGSKGRSAGDDGGRFETVRRFADQAAERAAHGRWAQVPPVDVPGVRASVAFALERILPPRAHLEQAAEAAAVAPQGIFHLVPKIAVAETGDDAEVHADIGHGAADRTAAHVGREFFGRGHAGRGWIVGAEKSGVGTAWAAALGARAGCRFRRGTVVRLQCDARRPGEAQIMPPGGAGEQIVPQGERAEEAALHALQDGWEIVGAEDGGGGGEFRGGHAGGGGRGEVAGVGDEGGEDFENSPDAPWDGAGFGGRVRGWGCLGHGHGGSSFLRTKQELCDRIPNAGVCGVGVGRRSGGLGWRDGLDHPERTANQALIRKIRRGGFGCDVALCAEDWNESRMIPGGAGGALRGVLGGGAGPAEGGAGGAVGGFGAGRRRIFRGRMRGIRGRRGLPVARTTGAP